MADMPFICNGLKGKTGLNRKNHIVLKILLIAMQKKHLIPKIVPFLVMTSLLVSTDLHFNAAFKTWSRSITLTCRPSLLRWSSRWATVNEEKQFSKISSQTILEEQTSGAFTSTWYVVTIDLCVRFRKLG